MHAHSIPLAYITLETFQATHYKLFKQHKVAVADGWVHQNIRGVRWSSLLINYVTRASSLNDTRPGSNKGQLLFCSSYFATATEGAYLWRHPTKSSNVGSRPSTRVESRAAEVTDFSCVVFIKNNCSRMERSYCNECTLHLRMHIHCYTHTSTHICTYTPWTTRTYTPCTMHTHTLCTTHTHTMHNVRGQTNHLGIWGPCVWRIFHCASSWDPKQCPRPIAKFVLSQT